MLTLSTGGSWPLSLRLHSVKKKPRHLSQLLMRFRICKKPIIAANIMTPGPLKLHPRRPQTVGPGGEKRHQQKTVGFQSLQGWRTGFQPLQLSPASGKFKTFSHYIIFKHLVSRPFILFSFTLSSFTLHPLILSPFILFPFVLFPFILSPSNLSPFILSPFVLFPSILFPSNLSPFILSPFV